MTPRKPSLARRDAVEHAVAAALALSPAEHRRFVRRLKDAGALERRPRGERLKVRNDRIQAMHDRGLTPGQIAKREGMSRGAVRMVLRRRKRAGYADPACALTPELTTPTMRIGG
jgi:hypothetical protein